MIIASSHITHDVTIYHWRKTIGKHDDLKIIAEFGQAGTQLAPN